MLKNENLDQIIDDVSKMSDSDVSDIRDEVAKRVVGLAKSRIGDQLLYDNHGSVHTKHAN